MTIGDLVLRLRVEVVEVDVAELVARRRVDVDVALAAWSSAAFEARENPAHDREALTVAGDALVEVLVALVPVTPH